MIVIEKQDGDLFIIDGSHEICLYEYEMNGKTAGEIVISVGKDDSETLAGYGKVEEAKEVFRGLKEEIKESFGFKEDVYFEMPPYDFGW